MMNQMKRAWFIAFKDLRLFATDRLALFFGLLFPFVFATAFYFVMQGVGGGDERLVVHLVTREAKGMSSRIIEAMVTKDESRLKPGETKVVWDKEYDAALRAVKEKKIPGFIAFPADFTEGVTMGYGASLEVVIDAEAAAARAALHGFARGIAARVGSEQIASKAVMSMRMGPKMTSGNRTEIAKIVEESLPAMSGDRKAADDLISFEAQKVGEAKAKNPSNFVIPGYLVMFVFFLAALGAEAIVRERQNQTLERLLASSVRKGTILAGIFGGTALKGLVQILIFWVAGLAIYGMDLGESPVSVMLLSVLIVVVASAFSLMLATLVRTQKAAIAIGVLTSLVLAPLGGCWWPLFITPKWMQFLARLTPHGWATTGFNKLLLFGADFGAVIPNVCALAAFALLFATIAVLRFRTSST